MDRSSEVDQASKALQATEDPTNVAFPRMVLRSRCAQTRMVVSYDDRSFRPPCHRINVRLVDILKIVALMRSYRTQTFAPQDAFDELRSKFTTPCLIFLVMNYLVDDWFLFLTIIYLLDIAVRLYGLGWGSYSANGWNIFDIIVAGGSLITILVVRLNTGGFAVQQLQKLFITSMAFKLVQRTNSLNKLFKTAV